MRKVMVRFLSALFALCFAAGPAAVRAEKSLLFTFTGDCTLGSEEKTKNEPTSFHSVLEREGADWFFSAFREMFEQDDCTVINLEGVLSDSARNENTGKTYRFRGPTSFVSVMTGSSVEAACLANNHTEDYGEQGLNSTVRTLEKSGIGWFRGADVYFFEKEGIRVAMMALDSRMYHNRSVSLTRLLRGLKDQGEVQAAVVLYHNGVEYDPRHDVESTKMAEKFITAGADLVIMHHPHVLQGVDIIGNRTVCYSLGNFVFGGNAKIRTVKDKSGRMVTALYCMAVQAELIFSDEGVYQGQRVSLIPAKISSDPVNNDYRPVPLTGEEAETAMEAVQYDTAFPLPGLTEADGFGRVIMPYLPAEKEE